MQIQTFIGAQPNIDLSAFTQHTPRKPCPAVLELIVTAKNQGSHWADMALAEVSVLTGRHYEFERDPRLNFIARVRL